MKFFFLLLLLTISACGGQNGQTVLQKKNLIELNITDILNNGSLSHQVKVNEAITINKSKDPIKWQIYLGKRDTKMVII